MNPESLQVAHLPLPSITPSYSADNLAVQVFTCRVGFRPGGTVSLEGEKGRFLRHREGRLERLGGQSGQSCREGKRCFRIQACRRWPQKPANSTSLRGSQRFWGAAGGCTQIKRCLETLQYLFSSVLGGQPLLPPEKKDAPSHLAHPCTPNKPSPRLSAPASGSFAADATWMALPGLAAGDELRVSLRAVNFPERRGSSSRPSPSRCRSVSAVCRWPRWPEVVSSGRKHELKSKMFDHALWIHCHRTEDHWTRQWLAHIPSLPGSVCGSVGPGCFGRFLRLAPSTESPRDQ